MATDPAGAVPTAPRDVADLSEDERRDGGGEVCGRFFFEPIERIAADFGLRPEDAEALGREYSNRVMAEHEAAGRILPPKVPWDGYVPEPVYVPGGIGDLHLDGGRD